MAIEVDCAEKFIKRARKLWPDFVAHMKRQARLDVKGEPRLVLPPHGWAA